MVIFARPVMAFAKGEFEVDYQIAMAFSHPGLFRRAAWWLGRHLRISLGFGLIAWLMSAPLIAYHFDQVNPWSIPAGLAMFPLVAASLLAGLLKIVLTLLAPGWARRGRLWRRCRRKGCSGRSRNLAKIPGSYLPAPHLSVGMIFLYYTLICLPLLAPLWPRGRWCLRLSPALACMLALLPLLVGAAPHAGQHDLRMTLLAIGAGQTAVIELPSGGVVLIDDGSSTLTDPVRTCLKPFLRPKVAAVSPEFSSAIPISITSAEPFRPSTICRPPAFISVPSFAARAWAFPMPSMCSMDWPPTIARSGNCTAATTSTWTKPPNSKFSGPRPITSSRPPTKPAWFSASPAAAGPFFSPPTSSN